MQNMFGLVPSYLRTSILMKARCVDAEWQAKRRESRRLQKSGARMTVAEMKGDSRGRETSPCDCTMCGAIPRVCQSDDKPWDAERLLGKRKRGCRAQWGVHGKGNCVRGWQRYSPQQWDQRAYGKKKPINVWLLSDWDGESGGYLTPPAGSRDLPGRICNSEQPPWVWEIGFPWLQQVPVTEAASVICRFWRRQC